MNRFESEPPEDWKRKVVIYHKSAIAYIARVSSSTLTKIVMTNGDEFEDCRSFEKVDSAIARIPD